MIRSIFNRLRQLGAPPVLPDRRATEAAATLHFILLGGAAVAIALLLTMPLSRRDLWSSVATYGVMLIAHCVALWRMRRGDVRAVAIAVSFFMFALITVSAQRDGGLEGIGIFVYPTVVIFAGLTWSAAAAVGFAVAASGAAFAMGLSQTGAALTQVTPVKSWLLLTGVVGMISLMLMLALRSMRAAEERERGLQDHLREAQKLEALGLFAGGVAHDFNNLLTVILLHTSLMKLDRERVPEGVEPIETAALRAADMTQQLLALGRRQSVLAKVVEVNQSLRDTVRLLRTLLPASIELRTVYGEHVGHTKMDPAGLERIVINLVINARDAMLEGGGRGEISVTTDRCTVDADHARRSRVPEGSYIRLLVRDNGPGISESIKGRLFEPFATTKASAGTGLGLASVRGIVLQSAGGICVESAAGKGACFEILLPPCEEPRSQPRPSQPPVSQASVRVLLLEADPVVRATLRAMLEASGYTVGEQDRDDSGLDTALDDTDVLLTDDLETTGRSLDDLRTRHPNLRIAIVRKPFTRDQLLTTLQTALSAV